MWGRECLHVVLLLLLLLLLHLYLLWLLHEPELLGRLRIY